RRRTLRARAHPLTLPADPRPPSSSELVPRPSRRLVRQDRPFCKCAAAERNSSAPLAPPAPPSRLRPAAQTAERVSTLQDCRPSATSSTERDRFSVLQAFDSTATATASLIVKQMIGADSRSIQLRQTKLC